MVPDERLVQLVGECEKRWGTPYTTTSLLADEVGLARQTIHKRLSRLHDEGDVRKYKPGGSAIWWVENS
jgi:DNA-binding Lrp family transcriptional regulator